MMPQRLLNKPRNEMTLKIGIIMTSSGIIRVEMNPMSRIVSPLNRYLAKAKPAMVLISNNRIVDVMVTMVLFRK
ncbi:hypothetical protein D1872_327840 [compost metagenome]